MSLSPAHEIACQAPRFGSHIAPDVQEALSELPIRSYSPYDYPYLDEWMKSLGAFYDGHDAENKLLDQLVNAEVADPRGFFTKSKALLVSHDEETGAPTGALCLNNKRGGAVKIGPVVVAPELRGRGIGKTLFQAADIFASTVGARKLYATTSHLNAPVNRLFEKYGFSVEATFPDQYKRGSQELIWGKFTDGHPNKVESERARAVSVVGHAVGPVATIAAYTEADRDYVAAVSKVYGTWHDDLGEDFVDGMIAGHERGLSFQEKGKLILIGKTACGEPAGTLTFTPKRGGPVKIYPVAGSPDAQAALFEHATDIAREHGNHKMYTFAHAEDDAQHAVLADQGFTKRGVLQSPYKDGHNLVAFDKMIS